MSNVSVLVDVSFLAAFVDAGRPHHGAAMAFYRYCVAQRVPLFLSTVVAEQFARRQPVLDLPLATMRVLPYNLPHAVKAAELGGLPGGEKGAEAGLPVDDLRLLAQAAVENIAFVASEHGRGLHRACLRLRQAGLLRVETIALADGFDPSWFTGGQRELRFGEED